MIVTGATGFIGNRLVRAALAQGWHVTALGRSRNKLDAGDSSQLVFEQWNAEGPLPHKDIFLDADAVCHLAAFIPPNFRDPAYASDCFRINALATLDLLKLAHQNKVRRFLHFSSGQIYKKLDRSACEDDGIFPSARAPFYLTSKLAAEIYVEHFRTNLGFPSTILRLGSVYGPGMRSGFISLFLERLTAGLPVQLYNGGHYASDLVYADDIVNVALRSLEREADGIFNVGSGVASSTLEVARTLADLVHAESGLISVQSSVGGVNDFGFSALDITKAQKHLSYFPTELKEGLKMLVLASQHKERYWWLRGG